MIAHYICSALHEQGKSVLPGKLYLTAASSHLYSQHWNQAEWLDNNREEGITEVQRKTPEILFQDTDVLLNRLRTLRTSLPGSDIRWWEPMTHLCDTCRYSAPTCTPPPPSNIVFGCDVDPTAIGAEADKVVKCNGYKRKEV
jgi:hypothetical protein